MALETATYLDGLDPLNPEFDDLVKEADDHMRLIKLTLQNTFPIADGAMPITGDGSSLFVVGSLDVSEAFTLAKGMQFTEQADHFYTPGAGFAQLWLNASNELIFTTAAGVDENLSGHLQAAPTPAAEQVAVFQDPDTIGGTADFQWSGSILTVNGLAAFQDQVSVNATGAHAQLFLNASVGSSYARLGLGGPVPHIRMQETDATTDQQYWLHEVDSDVMSHFIHDDSFSNPYTWQSITRSGLAAALTVDSINFTSAVSINFNVPDAFFSADVNLESEAKLYFDGGSNTYIAEQTNNLNTYVGGSQHIQLSSTGMTLFGRLAVAGSTTGRAGLRVQEGVAPTSPLDGDTWVTAAGEYFVRLNGVSVDLTEQPQSGVDFDPVGTDNSATHTGQVTGDTALILDVTAVTAQPASGVVIGADTMIINDGGVLSEVTIDQLDTFFGGGGGGIGGSITDNQVAVGATTADDIEGSASLTFNGTTLTAGYFAPTTALSAMGVGSSATSGLNLRGTGSVSDMTAYNTSGVAVWQVPTGTTEFLLAGKLRTDASTTGATGLNIPEGVAPSSPDDGDVWVTAAGEFMARLNGSTVDLAASGGGSPGGSDTELQYNDGGAFGGMSTLFYDDSALGNKTQLSLTPESTLTNGGILNMTANLSGFTGNMLYLKQDHASSTGLPLSVNQDGNAVTAQFFTVATTADCLSISSNSLTTGSLIGMNTNDAGVIGALIDIVQDHASAVAPGIAIQQDGTGPSIETTGGYTDFDDMRVTDFSELAEQYTATTGTRDLDVSGATYFYPSADLAAAVITFTFSNPAATGRVSSFTMELLGADGATLTWPTSVDWPASTEPTWTAGVDIVSFVTRDNGTTWHGFLGTQDSS